MAPERPALCYQGFVDGVDVSSANAPPDWKKVYAAGFRFAYVKCAEGVAGRDPKAREYLNGAEDAGLLTGEYLFLRPSQGNAKAQVDNARNATGVFEGRLLLDAENGPDNWTDQQLVDFYEACVEADRQWTVMVPAMYYFPWWALRRIQPALSRSTVLAQCPLHIADYGGNAQPWLPPLGFKPVIPPPYKDWTMHQYSGNGGYRVPGMPGDTDRDLFNGDMDALRAFFGLPATTTADEPTRIVSPPVDFPVRTYNEPGPDGEADTLKVPYSRPPVEIVHDESDDEPPPQAA